MSDAAAISAAMGVPEELVVRSATARAQASGTDVATVLAAWSGGGSVATAPKPDTAPAPVADAEPTATPSEPAAPTTPDTTPVPAAATAQPTAQPATAPAVMAPDSDAAPILVGRKDHPLVALAGLVALFIFGSMLAVGVPSIDALQAAQDQIPGSTPVLSDLAESGRDVYVQEGCMYCHTQQVRSVVADVGLGPVTEPGLTPVPSSDGTFAVETLLPGPANLGHVRIGPDLTHVGTRVADTPDYLHEVLTDPRGVNPSSLMPSYAYLSDRRPHRSHPVS